MELLGLNVCVCSGLPEGWVVFVDRRGHVLGVIKELVIRLIAGR